MNTAQLLVKEKSAYAKVEPPCPYFGTCGGCTLQDLAYADQLALKRERLQRTFAALDFTVPIEVVPLDDPWRYRNKAELTFGQSEGRLTLGYHAARSFWRVIDIEDCLLLPQRVVVVLRDLLRLAMHTGLPAYHPRTHQGFFRYLVVRSSRSTGQILLCLVTTSGSRAAVELVAQELMERHPDIVSMYWGLTDKVADVAVPDELTLVRGRPYLDDQIGPFRLQLHPFSFLQPTSAQAERIYERVCRSVRDIAPAVAWDLYCGVGVIAFYLARHVRKVYGIDSEPHHLELAALNASRNGVHNVEFRVGRVETLLMDRRFWLTEARPDIVVVDPPRAGLQAQALSSIIAARPRRIIYLSCNVQSLIHDLRVVLSSFPRYRLSDVTAFDMFPQTNHLETLVLLERA